MKKAIGAYLAFSSGQLWIATRDILPATGTGQKVFSLNHKGLHVMPLPGGLPAEGVDGAPRAEVLDVLANGHAYEGSVVVSIDHDGVVGLVDGYGLRRLTAATITEEDQDVLLAVERAAVWMARMRPALPEVVRTTLADCQFAGPDEVAPTDIGLTITVASDRVLIVTEDERKVAVELMNGDLRVFAFEHDAGKEYPVVVTIPPRGEIGVEMSDYTREERPDDAPGLA
ncbi:hypothetical protein OCH239_09750 [Roseivivax halodurans JCM 10272]|uniref:Uncharacterized protein n=1 Tax=Roseivivax halodurans JCM 10272 TaxID=1449350 RepID=X7EEK5_9RHOB|nr:hypothetical protein [Roseivivax halodurans]ETX13553.1 hypothetical protein OCH239_09750 [Roseivivax halodurans JCM 10272]